MTSTRTIEYLDPVSPNTDKKLDVPAVGELKGKTIGFLSNGGASYNAMGAKVGAVFRETHGMRERRTCTIPTSCAPPDGLLEQVATECDAAIVGMAKGDSCTSWRIHDTARLVKRGMPDFDVSAWNGSIAPARVADDIVAKIYDDSSTNKNSIKSNTYNMSLHTAYAEARCTIS